MRTHIDLFSGLGGFALAAAWTGFRTVVMCEKDLELQQFLRRSWGLPVIDDVREFDGSKWRGATLLTAGVPCQPVSHAGKRRGTEDDRWLWPEVIRIIAEAKPAWVICENPYGLKSMGESGIPFEVVSREIRRGTETDEYRALLTRQERMQLDIICGQIEDIGYDITILDIPACAVNSPQIRRRLWIVANSHDAGLERSDTKRTISTARRTTKHVEYNILADCEIEHGSGQEQETSECGRDSKNGAVERTTGDVADSRHGSRRNIRSLERGDHTPTERPNHTGETNRSIAENMADAESESIGSGLCPGRPAELWRRRSRNYLGAWDDVEWLRCGDDRWRRAKPGVCGLAYGVSKGLLAGLGNAVVPQVPGQLMDAIVKAEDMENETT